MSMAGLRMIRAIEREAKERAKRGLSDAYSLLILLRSGRELECEPFAIDNDHFLKVNERRVVSSAGDVEDRIALIAFEAIDRVVPSWH